MRSEPRWLHPDLVLTLHDILVAEHGGLAGLRDAGLLESALARPRNLWTYGKPDLFDLAASYASGLVRDHPFLDGNKRTAFAAACVFLEDNGIGVDLVEAEVVESMVSLAAGKGTESEFAAWMRRACGRNRRAPRSRSR
jgi:death-on-curing protein